MHEISYAGEHLLAADDAVIALLDFAALLADAGQAQTIEFPIITEQGDELLIRMLVGPASQLIARPVAPAESDPDVAAFVQEVHRRSREYAPVHAVASRPEAADDNALLAEVIDAEISY
jgi:hypothetical protein